MSDKPSDKTKDVFLRIIRSVEAHNRLEKMSNKEIGDLLMHHIWADLPLTDARSALLSVAIDRLKGETEAAS